MCVCMFILLPYSTFICLQACPRQTVVYLWHVLTFRSFDCFLSLSLHFPIVNLAFFSIGCSICDGDRGIYLSNDFFHLICLIFCIAFQKNRNTIDQMENLPPVFVLFSSWSCVLLFVLNIYISIFVLQCQLNMHEKYFVCFRHSIFV